MNIFIYDKTFEGLLTLIFDSYDRKMIPDRIVSNESFQAALFGEKIEVVSDVNKANRVWKGLSAKLSKEGCQRLYRAHLSESEEADMLIFKQIKNIFSKKYNIERDYRDERVLGIKNLSRKVSREACKMIEFVRFQKTADDIYFSPVSPDYNVLPLIGKHFQNRLPDQQWVIYDIKRKYGLFYDLKDVSEITIDNRYFSTLSGKIEEAVLSEDEKQFQNLWKDYFNSINIKERKNLRQQMHFMPKKYRKFLTEVDKF
jgi:probable DNA metabolism protein